MGEESNRTEIERIKSEIRSLRTDFEVRIAYLEEQVRALDKSHQIEVPPSVQVDDQLIASPDIVEPQGADESITPQYTVPPKSSQTIVVKRRQREKPLSVTLLSFLEYALGPFGGLLGDTVSLYRHYRAQGKAPIFFMTVAGIIALLLGFGYLMQYSFNHFLGETGKVAAGFLISIVVVGIGIRLTKKSERMREYASGIIGLGILLCYSCTYFASGYYQLFGSATALLLLSLITAAAYVLAHLFATRIVAVITLLGGATTPLFLHEADSLSNLYFAYLLILSVSALRLASSVRWPPLAQLAMLVSVAMIEMGLINQSSQFSDNIIFTVLLHAFFYCYGYYGLLQLSRSPAKPEKRILITIASNLALFILALYQAVSSDNLLATLYVVNSLVFIGLFVAAPFKRWLGDLRQSAARSVLALYAASLFAFAALMLLGPDFVGAIWGLEGLLLFYLGLRFNIATIRVEGYVAYLLGLVAASYALFYWLSVAINITFYKTSSLTFSGEWFSLMAMGAVIFGMVKLPTFYRSELIKFDKKILHYNNELFSLWISISFFITVAIIDTNLLLVTAPIPLFYQLHRTRTLRLNATEWFAMTHYILLLIQIALSAQEASSFHFTQQNWLGKIARIEAFLCLIGIAEFYRRYYPSGRFANFADKLRQLFFLLLSLFFLPVVARRAEAWFPVMIWGSLAISLSLHRLFKYRSLLIESYVLAIAACSIALLACAGNHFNAWQGHGFMALIVGVVMFTVLVWLWEGLSRPRTEQARLLCSHYGKLLTIGLYYFGAAIFVVSFGMTKNVSLALLLFFVYWLAWYVAWPIKQPLRHRPLSFYYVAHGILICWIGLDYFRLVNHSSHFTAVTPLYLLVACGILGFINYSQRPAARLIQRSFDRQNIRFWVFHVMLVMSYFVASYHWFDSSATIILSLLLVTHATLLLIASIQPRLQAHLKISIICYALVAAKVLLLDMAGYSLVEKILAFMVTGVILLIAAYFYQRIKPVSVEGA